VGEFWHDMGDGSSFAETWEVEVSNMGGVNDWCLFLHLFAMGTFDWRK
jgi:hypothetical protein